MDYLQPKILAAGAAGVVAVWFVGRRLLAAPSADAGAGPALVTYVSPGNANAAYHAPGSTTASDSGSSSDAAALGAAASHSVDATLSYQNTDSLMSFLADTIKAQAAKLKVGGSQGFTSDLHASLALTSTGSPTVDLHTDFTPKAMLGSAKAIADLKASVVAAGQKVSLLNSVIATQRTTINNLSRSTPGLLNFGQTAGAGGAH